MNLEVIYSKIRCGAYMPPPNPPAAKFTSQGGAQVRTDAQIKFLYYPWQHGVRRNVLVCSEANVYLLIYSTQAYVGKQ